MSNDISYLHNKVEKKIATNDLSNLNDDIASILEINPVDLYAHNLKEKYKLAGNFSDWMGVDAQISTADDIFKFFVNHPTSKNPIRDYLSDGWRTMIELQDVLDKCDLSLRRCNHFLEFACGHGRFTRHLARIFKDEQLVVSDVVAGSVDFLKDTLKVAGFYSSTDPDKINIPGHYDVIFVLSLFSHLPKVVWHQWFKVLYESLDINGVLIFSTHGSKCARMDGVDWGDGEYRFYPSSESSVLDGQTYGATYASAEYVMRVVRDALGHSVKAQAIEGHFWARQDAIVVTKR